MSAKAVSYAAVLRNAAEHADIRARDAVGPRTAAHYSAEAAALRALAARMEILLRDVPPAPSGLRLTEVGAREFIEPEAAMRFAAFCAAGYTPPEDGPR